MLAWLTDFRRDFFMSNSNTSIKKIVLAYSGGLDTSTILKWLQINYQAEVITYTANLGQEEDYEAIRETAKKYGITKIYIEDLAEDFVKDYVFPMFRANTLYEGEYLLGTSIARPLIAKRLSEVALAEGAEAICHGATGKGNDQVRFEFGAAALAPQVQTIAPWRFWDLTSRTKLLEFCQAHGVAVKAGKENAPPYSMDANLLHISYEGGILEDPSTAPEESMWQMTQSIDKAPQEPEIVEIEFLKGDPVAINSTPLSPASILRELNRLGGKHGIGRLDIVENRFIGMKSRGCYETPGGSLLLKAHRAIESICLDREVVQLKDSLMPRYASYIYNGLWFSPEREALQALIDASQRNVIGKVCLKLHKGNMQVVSRTSPCSLYNPSIASFEEVTDYYPEDANGFIRLNSLRLRAWAEQKRKL